MPLKMTDLGEEFLLQEDALNVFWDNETLCQRMQCQGYAGDTDDDGSFWMGYCDVPPAPTLQQRKWSNTPLTVGSTVPTTYCTSSPNIACLLGAAAKESKRMAFQRRSCGTHFEMVACKDGVILRDAIGILYQQIVPCAVTREGRILEGRSGRWLSWRHVSDPLREFLFLIPTTLGSIGLEVMVPRRTCFYQETQEESLRNLCPWHPWVTSGSLHQDSMRQGKKSRYWQEQQPLVIRRR